MTRVDVAVIRCSHHGQRIHQATPELVAKCAKGRQHAGLPQRPEGQLSDPDCRQQCDYQRHKLSIHQLSDH